MVLQAIHKEIIESKYRDKVRYFYQKNKGASAVRNMGIKESKGECLVFLDADEWFAFKKNIFFR